MYQLPSNGAKPIPQEPLEREDEFQRIWGAVRRRKRAFWWIFGGFMALALAYAFVWPKQWQTTVNILTGNSATNFNGVNTDLPVLNALIAAGGVQSAETYATMVQDYDVATQVIDDLHLHT